MEFRDWLTPGLAGADMDQWGLEEMSRCGECARRVMSALEMCRAVGVAALRTAEKGGCYEAAL